MFKGLRVPFFSFFYVLACFSFAQCPSSLGVYYWGGQQNSVDTSLIIPTAKKLADSLGVHTIRITLACNNDVVYKNGGPCLTGMNLTSLASRSDFNSIITDPQFSTVIITAYDWTSFRDCNTTNFIDSTFYTPANIAAIETEFTNLANYLKQFTSKTFIITNWEGDNAVYGGAAYSNPNYPQAPANMVGFRKWMMARSNGIAAANASNVKFGIEFCNIHSLENLGKVSVLNDVIPYVNADYFLYSAYESFNVSSNQLAADIDFVRTKLSGFGKNPAALLIGEMGFGKNDWGSASNAADSLQKTINVVIQKNIPYAISWVLIDTPFNFGMYDDNGVISPSGTVLKNSACQSASIDKTNKDSQKINIAPNPSEGEFLFGFKSIGESIDIKITDAIGRGFYFEHIDNCIGYYQTAINLDHLPSGIYFMQVNNASKCFTEKVLISQR